MKKYCALLTHMYIGLNYINNNFQTKNTKINIIIIFIINFLRVVAFFILYLFIVVGSNTCNNEIALTTDDSKELKLYKLYPL